MPHITIEYSGNLADAHDVDVLVAVVHEAALDHDWVPLSALRTRAVAREHYRVADGAPENAFVALTIRVGPGRTPEEKRSLLESLLAAAVDSVESVDDRLAIAWSIEVQEIDAEWRVNLNRIRERSVQAEGF